MTDPVEHEIEITLKWKNQAFFEMTQKLDASPKITVLRVEENSNIAQLWEYIAAICNTDFGNHIAKIGQEMKS